MNEWRKVDGHPLCRTCFGDGVIINYADRDYLYSSWRRGGSGEVVCPECGGDGVLFQPPDGHPAGIFPGERDEPLRGDEEFHEEEK